MAYDVAQTRQKHAFSDHSDLVARRMGFIPLPLGVVIIRVLVSSIKIEDLPSAAVFLVAYLCMASFKILNSLLILGKACNLITQHKQEKASYNSPNTNRSYSPSNLTSRSKIDIATSPLRPIVDQPQSQSNGFPPIDTNIGDHADITSDLGPSAIFANSNVDLKNASLNEELLKVEGDEIKIESVDDSVTRSFPNIKSDFSTKDIEHLEDSFKRSESEPNLNKIESDNTPK